MPLGQGELISPLSYAGVGRETAFGTYTTATAGIHFIASSIKTLKETKILEQIETSRTFSQRIGLGRTIEGDLEFFVDPLNLAFGFFLQNAFGGAVTSATATGETVGGLAFTHTFQIGNITDQTNTSLCLNVRKGDSSGGKIFQYSGIRINELGIVAEIDEAVKGTVSFMGKDSTLTTNDVASALTNLQATPLSFVNGRVSVENTFASLTSTSFWHVQSVEWGISNSLKSDTDSRRIGSDTVDVIPPGMAVLTLNTSVRFDTTTAYDAMLAETQLSAQLEFLGETLTGSLIRKGLRLDMPKLFIMDAGDPEISGPDETLKSDIVFAVLRDASSATGFAIQAVLTNLQANYD